MCWSRNWVLNGMRLSRKVSSIFLMLMILWVLWVKKVVNGNVVVVRVMLVFVISRMIVCSDVERLLCMRLICLLWVCLDILVK